MADGPWVLVRSCRWRSSMSHEPSAIQFLRDLILLEFLVQIAARRADHFGGLRDVPAVLAQLANQKHPLGVLLELAQRPGLRVAGGFAGGGLRRGHAASAAHPASVARRRPRRRGA